MELLVSPRRGDDLVPARQIGEAAVLWNEVHTVRAFGAGKGEMAQQRHEEDEELHTSQRLPDTGSLPCDTRHNHKQSTVRGEMIACDCKGAVSEIYI